MARTHAKRNRLARAGALAMALAVAVVAAPLSSQAAGTFLLGQQAVLTVADSNPAGVPEAFQTTASASGSLSTVTVYVDAGSTATSLVAGVYADNAGHPGALLTQGTLNAPAAGAWNDVPMP